jgi:hypothetical protein
VPASIWLVLNVRCCGVDRSHESTFVGRQVPADVAGVAPPAPPRRCEAEADDERAAALHERLARELLVEHLGHGYFPPFAITAAAFWMAVRSGIGAAPAEVAVHRGADLPPSALRRGQKVGGLIIIPFWQ